MSATLAAGWDWAARAAIGAVDGVRGPRLSILIFHRVLPAPDPIFPAEMHAARFDGLMRSIARSYRVLPLDQAARRLADGSLPGRALAITFDDGYADNHDVAMPILQRHGLTATFFVATSFVDGGRMWNDTAIECIRRATRDRIDLGFLGLGMRQTHDVAARRAAIDAAIPMIKYQDLAAREVSLAQLHAACGAPVLPDDLMMSSAQVRAMHRHGMSIGAHTRRHPILATLSDADSEAEIAGSREHLQNLVDAPVSLFAYPNGRPDTDFEERHVRIVRRLGFEAAVSTDAGACRVGDDAFRLRRFTPWQTSDLRWKASLARARLER